MDNALIAHVALECVLFGGLAAWQLRTNSTVNNLQNEVKALKEDMKKCYELMHVQHQMLQRQGEIIHSISNSHDSSSQNLASGTSQFSVPRNRSSRNRRRTRKTKKDSHKRRHKDEISKSQNDLAPISRSREIGISFFEPHTEHGSDVECDGDVCYPKFEPQTKIVNEESPSSDEESEDLDKILADEIRSIEEQRKLKDESSKSDYDSNELKKSLNLK
jgi:hypothetical protein